MSRTLWPLAALATLAVIVAGCENGTQGVPAGTGNSTVTSGGSGTASIHEKAVKFAECMRANGVPDFPDPTPNGPLVDTNRIPSAATTSGMSILNATMRKCGHLAAPAGVTGDH